MSFSNTNGPKACRKRKASGATLEEDLKVPESQEFQELLTFERQLDRLCGRKRSELANITREPPQKLKKTLRVFLTSTVETESDNAISWALRVDGKLMDDASMSRYEANRLKRKFSTYLQKIYVEFDTQDSKSQWSPAEWQRTQSTVECDGFDISRSGVPEKDHVQAKVLLFLDYSPPQFKLAKHLAETIGLYQATKQQVYVALWQYIREKSLQNKTNSEWIECDPYLKRIFGGENRVKLSDLATKVNPLLFPPKPLELSYRINLDPQVPMQKDTYEVEVEIDDPNKTHANSALSTHTMEKEVKELDDRISGLIKEVDDVRSKRDFMLLFSRDPEEFIHWWLASYARDNKEASSAAGRLSEEQRSAQYYNSSSVQEAVYRYYAELMSARRRELESKEQAG
eukprot:m.10634 g.10634  ORF g.10634 m.10634 type:complete len:400 (+) comp4298_c0_seq1:159-1358(+)